ncbi:MAG: tetratricopeptide repeat protein [Chloroflexota bacterium]
MERALAIRERVLGADHPDTATSLVNLGILLYEQGE